MKDYIDLKKFSENIKKIEYHQKMADKHNKKLIAILLLNKVGLN